MDARYAPALVLITRFVDFRLARAEPSISNSRRTRPRPRPLGASMPASVSTVGVTSGNATGASMRARVLKDGPQPMKVLRTTHGFRPPWPLAPPLSGPVVLLLMV